MTYIPLRICKDRKEAEELVYQMKGYNIKCYYAVAWVVYHKREAKALERAELRT